MKIIDAVSLVLECDGEVFMITRQHFLKAFPGYHAFPGGKVDKGDHNLRVEKEELKDFPAHLISALNREAIEELDFDIYKGFDDGKIKSISYLGEAITPDFNPYRFSTHFYLIRLNEKPTFKVDENEAKEYGWQLPEKYIEQYQSGQMLIVPPIFNLIKIMQKDIANSKGRKFDFTYNSEEVVPCIESICGIKQFMPLSNTVPPANRTNCFLIGDIIVDPSPKNELELKKLCNSLKSHAFSKIFITHHHGDHYEWCHLVAKEFKSEFVMSKYTFDRIIEKNGDQYFAGFKVNIVDEGDVITQWLGQNVITYHVPGHAQGQLALASQDLTWFIVGDLIQGIGTVVIGGKSGDMKKYFDSLEKVIKLDPKYIIPSHGIAMGTTYRIKKTLEHRIMREQQVLDLYSQGKSKEEILYCLYHDIDQRLLPYASENIEKHLIKLKNEKRIDY